MIKKPKGHLRLKGLFELQCLAMERKSVVVPEWPSYAKPKPASVVINLPGIMLLKMFAAGMYLYQKPQPKGRDTRWNRQ